MPMLDFLLCYRRFLKLVQKVNATLSVGGWTGSGFFSQILSSPTSMSTFVTSLVNLTQTYQLDGLDFEYGPLLFPHVMYG